MSNGEAGARAEDGSKRLEETIQFWVGILGTLAGFFGCIFLAVTGSETNSKALGASSLWCASWPS
jgi:hypothetical protein